MRIISVCSGGGGLDLGLRQAVPDARTVCYIEREAFAAACLVARMHERRLDEAPIWDDLCTFDGRPWRGVVDCVAGGTPCQDLSVAGKQAGLDGERSRLFFEQVRVADECEAPFFFWENVGGARRALPAVFAELERHGYVGAAVLVRASDVGAPHQRARYFLLAHRPGVRLRAFRSWGVGDTCGGAGQLQRAAGDVGGEERGARGEGLATAGCESRPAGADVALSDGEGWERWRRPTDGGAAGTGPQRRAEGPDSDVADASGAGQQGGQRTGAPREGAGAPRPAPERCRPLEWPPGPGDVDGWARVLAERPDLAPSQPRVRRVAHELARGVVPAGRPLGEWQQPGLDSMWADRLRLLGNGVVPAQAAAAFTFLWRHLEGRQVTE